MKVNISNCRIREKFSSINDGVDGPRWCIRSASLSARALPEHKPDILGIANISEGLGHTFIEKHPYSDSYYYLLVFTEGETDLTVTIKTKGIIFALFQLNYVIDYGLCQALGKIFI